MKLRSLLFFLCSTSTAHLQPLQDDPTARSVQRNANHIFNSVHSSMRQWDSSLHHNGMSFYLATVPAGTEFYHGSRQADPVIGMEWFSFEPEHAEFFSRAFFASPKTIFEESGRREEYDPKQIVLNPATGSTPQRPGFLHTYVSSRNLRLLYIDGMAAAKSKLGTLDTQDYVLLNKSRSEWFPTVDWRRAKELCEKVEKQWGGRIDGYIRMEAGFEMVLCAVENVREIVSVTQTKVRNATCYIPAPLDGWDDYDAFTYLRAVTTRYHGIGSGRVVLDYESFVTAYAYPIEFSGSKELPRLENCSSDSFSDIERDVTNLVYSEGPSLEAFNWQTITDMVVAKYAKPLKEMVSGKFTTHKSLSAQVDRIMLPYIDYADRNATKEIERCTTHFLPPNYTRFIASEAIYHISNLICSTLSSVAWTDDYDFAIQSVRGLIQHLDWATWKECDRCDYDRICFVPMWPIGDREDYKSPSCLSSDDLRLRAGYWELEDFLPPP